MKKRESILTGGFAKVVKVFEWKYYPEGGDFHQNPEGLTLKTRGGWSGGSNPPNFAELFYKFSTNDKKKEPPKKGAQ